MVMMIKLDFLSHLLLLFYCGIHNIDQLLLSFIINRMNTYIQGYQKEDRNIIDE
jgi:hypothetical protein